MTSTGANGPGLLLAEDEPEIRELLAYLLEQNGFRVFKARNGAHALEVYAAHAHEIHRIVLDVSMPRLDGLAAYQRLRAEGATAPVLFLSGYADHAEAVALAKTDPKVSLLAKPCDETELIAQLNRT